MHQVTTMGKHMVRKTGMAFLAAVVAMTLAVVPLAAPAHADAAELVAAGTSSQLSTQAASYEKAVVKNAGTIISKSKAKSGKSLAKLKKIYTYIAKDKSFGGVYQFGQLYDFYLKSGGSTYYSMLPKNVVNKSLLKKYYKKYAVDMYTTKKGTCFHYASLFAVAAKKALGKSATVKIAAGPSKHTGSKIDWHSWVEVKIGKKTYVYDPQAGNTKAKSAGSATKFGKFCGAEKSKLKSNYYNYKGVKYVTVKL